MSLLDVKQTSLREASQSLDTRVDVGILTKGKPTLGMALTSLLLQEDVDLRIHIVDTSPRPVISREDVRFALRLASDRRIHCSYEYGGESDLAFSAGKARLIRVLNGVHLCLTDDDVVLPSRALRQLLNAALDHGVYGYVGPFCRNSATVSNGLGETPPISPGSLIFQDAIVRRILTEYYETTVDVLDRRKSEHKVWETAFLTALFDELDRPQIRESDLVTYHLDYHEAPCCIDEEATVVARSRTIAHELAEKARAETYRLTEYPLIRQVASEGTRQVHGRWARRALQVLSWVR